MENEYTLILSRICNIQNNFLNTYIVDVFKPLVSSDFPGLFNKCVQLKWNYKKINQFKHWKLLFSTDEIFQYDKINAVNFFIKICLLERINIKTQRKLKNKNQDINI